MTKSKQNYDLAGRRERIDLRKCLDQLGMKIFLEELISILDESGYTDDYIIKLKKDLKKTLLNYEARYTRFPEK
jgi:hypothetical protein